MKVMVCCGGCFQEDGHPLNAHTVWHEVNDRGAYLTLCPRGHKTISVVQQQKFEVLFELGANALLDDYPGEAIARFASSLERFFEYFIRVIAVKHSIDLEAVNGTWKEVAGSSERQYGAYLFFHLLHYGTSPQPNPEKMKPAGSRSQAQNWKAFRNSVVHKGYIPSTAEAMAYGELVYDFINGQVRTLLDTAGNDVGKATILLLQDGFQAFAEEGVVFNQTIALPGIVGILKGGSATPFFEALEEVRGYRYLMGNSR